jgi:NAD(P)-dependent dehydrogenase (short-subunit alcohol dehydrogenase family)
MMNMESWLKGRRVVLTGVSRGIGRAVAETFLQSKAQLIGVSRDKKNLAKAKAELSGFGKAVSFVCGDIGEPKTAVLTAKEVEKRWGALDLLINCAAISRWAKSFEEDQESWLEESFRINVLSQHYMTRNLLPYLRKGKEPRILNFGSGAGKISGVMDGESGDMGSYRLTKMAVNGLTMLYATQLKGKVSVLSFDPGWIKTDLGGPNAPDEVGDAVKRFLDTLSLPWKVTGKFVKGQDILPW